MTKPSSTVITKFPVLDDFFAVDWKDIPLRHAYGVYALCLYANLPEYAEIAAESLTEGDDDKDCDLCLIDSESGDAFVVQATVSNDWNQQTAPTNKADDLLTALSWLLTKPYDRIPWVSWFSLNWKKRLDELASEKGLQVLGVGIVSVIGDGATVSSSLFRVAGSVGSGMCRRSHRSVAAS